ncbi:TetR/AcrR family transcriptional regulator [Desulfatibacillum aliphaticivorans]|uniref:TetR/AcrR family transcriptional regulator n=1 Tax=Desulfatibacillum aliphaticivorans TaxID=218208 RepID=UPI000407F6B5|nr:TetR/AcrR family transcriptional regulator [Desulfatibacillum aliphaticivorans]
MATTRKPNKATPKRKRRIILAALEIFNEKGFTDATMQEIRQRSGASYGSVYHHFKSKELLAAAVYMEGLKDYQEGMIAFLESGPGAEEGVRGMVGRHLDWIASNPAWAKFLLNMRHADFMQDSEARIEMSNQDFIPVIGLFLDKYMAVGRLRPIPRDVGISIILGPCQEFTRLWVQGIAYTEIEQAKELIGHGAWQAMKAQHKQGGRHEQAGYH